MALAHPDLISLARAKGADHDISIAAGQLGVSLTELSRPTGLSAGMDLRLPSVVTNRVHGHMSPDAALRKMLRDTGIRPVRVGDGVYRLEPVGGYRANTLRSQPALPPALQAADIVVTATKREESYATLPISLSVVRLSDGAPGDGLSGTALVADATDGLTLTNLGPGRNRLFVRGVADSPFNGPSQSTVNLQIDDSRATFNAPDPDLKLLDVERVEILKGPQGPLYGTGTLGGVYHIVTRKPDLTWTSGFVFAEGLANGAGATGGGGGAMLNLPVVHDRLGLRASGYSSKEPGWIDSGGRRNSNSTKLWGGRALLRAAIADDWILDVAALTQSLSVADSQYVVTAVHELTRANRIAEPHDNDFRMAHAELHGRIGAVDVVAASGIVRHDVDSILDASDMATTFGLNGPTIYADNRKYRVFDNEFRLSHMGTRGISWLVGVSLLNADSRFQGVMTPLSGGNPVSVVDQHQRAKERALFGEISAAVTRQIKLAAGARAFRSVVKGASIIPAQIANIHKSGITPSATISWQPDRHSFFFLRYAAAFRPAGLGLGQRGGASGKFESDELSTVELSARLEPVVDRLRMEATLFATEWSDIQADYLLPNGLIATHNAGDGRIRGMDVSVVWSPALPWSVEIGGTAQRARLTRAAAGLALGNDPRLPVVPDVALRFSLARDFRVGQWRGQAKMALNYSGPSRLSFDPGLDRHMGNVLQGGLSTTLSRDHWQVGVHVSNLFDSRADSFAFGNPFSSTMTAQRTPMEPRRLTVTVARAF